MLDGFEFIGNNNSNNQGTWNAQDNSDVGFGDMIPVDYGDMPF